MSDFEQRADQLSLDDTDQTAVIDGIFLTARKKLLARGAKLLVGPRGAGKTHIMRATYHYAFTQPTQPLAFYSNFARYLTLEPLLTRSPDAIQRFHTWVLARILVSMYALLDDIELSKAFLEQSLEVKEADLITLVSLLERGEGEREYEDYGRKLTVEKVLNGCRVVAKKCHRPRTILLLDDAALSLSGEYLIAFFEIFRLLKAEDVSPKASVYPGSTQYGPTFHAAHEAEEVNLWLSVESDNYSELMGEISQKRFPGEAHPRPEISEVLKYLAFGIPRAYLRLLTEFNEAEGSSTQQKINSIVDRQSELILAEYDSLAKKLPQFASVIGVGRKLLESLVTAVRDGNRQASDNTCNIVVGINRSKQSNPLQERMIRFLVEVGLLYPLEPVSHGVDRKYDRYIPHLILLYEQGVFRSGRGSSLNDVPSYLSRLRAKHPIRRELSTLLDPSEIGSIKIDLPTCQKCGQARLNESQRFCHNCGEQLTNSSLFENCMRLELSEIPEISGAIIQRIYSDTNIRTVAHIYGSRNAFGALQEAHYVGPVRASKIVESVTIAVNEFLS